MEGATSIVHSIGSHKLHSICCSWQQAGSVLAANVLRSIYFNASHLGAVGVHLCADNESWVSTVSLEVCRIASTTRRRALR